MYAHHHIDLKDIESSTIPKGKGSFHSNRVHLNAVQTQSRPFSNHSSIVQHRLECTELISRVRKAQDQIQKIAIRCLTILFAGNLILPLKGSSLHPSR